VTGLGKVLPNRLQRGSLVPEAPIFPASATDGAESDNRAP